LYNGRSTLGQVKKLAELAIGPTLCKYVGRAGQGRGGRRILVWNPWPAPSNPLEPLHRPRSSARTISLASSVRLVAYFQAVMP